MCLGGGAWKVSHRSTRMEGRIIATNIGAAQVGDPFLMRGRCWRVLFPCLILHTRRTALASCDLLTSNPLLPTPPPFLNRILDPPAKLALVSHDHECSGFGEACTIRLEEGLSKTVSSHSSVSSVCTIQHAPSSHPV